MHLLWECLAAAAAGASLLGVSFAKPLWMISMGYGSAMTLQSAWTYCRRRDEVNLFGRVHLGLLGLFGLRTVGFLLWRDRLRSFKPSKEKRDGRMATISPAKRILMLGFCSALYLSMFLPAYYSTQPGPKASPGSPLYRLGTAALVLAGGCLVLETVADVTQQLYYQRGGKSPCRAGIWSFSHNANYHAEIGFWVASYLAGAPSYPGALEAATSSVGAAAMAWILLHGAKRRRDRQAAAAAEQAK